MALYFVAMSQSTDGWKFAGFIVDALYIVTPYVCVCACLGGGGIWSLYSKAVLSGLSIYFGNHLAVKGEHSSEESCLPPQHSPTHQLL